MTTPPLVDPPAVHPPTIRAPRGRELSCKGWHQEAALRMLHEQSRSRGGREARRADRLRRHRHAPRATGRRSTPSCARSRSLENDETLLVQSGKPVGIFRTHPEAPRVLIANSNLVGHWSNWDEFNRLERLGLIMYGQMTAGSWIYIGSQGIVQGTYETFAAAAREAFRRIARGQAGGLGRNGRDGRRAAAGGDHERRLLPGHRCRSARASSSAWTTGYCDRMARNLDDALRRCDEAQTRGEALSVGLVGNCADVLPEMVRRGIVPDVLTDQTSAHDPLNGYVPQRHDAGRSAPRCALPIRTNMCARSIDAMGAHVDGDAGAAKARRGDVRLRQQHPHAGARRPAWSDAFDIPGFVPEYIRPLFCEGRGPFRWVALSGDPADIHRTDRAGARTVSAQRNAGALDAAGAGAHPVPGAARAHLLAGLRRARRIRRGHQPTGAVGRIEGAHRDRPRSSGCRLGGVALSRNRSHARRLRRHRRLAAAQCAGEYRGRRVLGLDPQRRRRGHRLLATCRHGGGGRWHRRDSSGAWSACSPPTPAWASSATPTPATRKPSRFAREHGVAAPWIRQ